MTVYLVGAGPGDPGLLTVRGAALLGQAELVVHDRLTHPRLLDLVAPSAQRVDVGKQPGSAVDQVGINQLLVEAGRAGRCVVRLKGGDPFVFGRGGEEALALQAAGIDYEVVPGVSAAVAAPAYAGVPLTHRGMSSCFTVVTGHPRARSAAPPPGRAPQDELDWEALARVGGTVVVLMGVAHRGEIADRLMAGGRDPGTPVVAVRWGTRPDQQVLRTTLAELGRAQMEAPVTMVIGPVAGLHLDWYTRLPLLGRRVVVTRPAHQASSLVERLARVGAEALEVPVIELGPPADGGGALRAAAARARHYDWVVFTSANAVAAFLGLLVDARGMGTAQVAAIGPGTAAALGRRGVVADLVAQPSVAEALVAAFPPPPAAGGGRVLVPRAAVARGVLPAGLQAAGWQVDVVEAYRTRPVGAAPAGVSPAEAAAADAIAFTSASTVGAYLEVMGRDALPPLVACIGPLTAARAEAEGVVVDVVADPHTLDGLVAALVAETGRRRDGPPGAG